MKGLLVFLAVVFNAFDNWTTWICLRDPAAVAKWGIIEVNIIAAWIFDFMGLEWGLIFEYALTLGALAFIAKTGYLGHRTKICILVVLCLLAGTAALNNFWIITELGLLSSWFDQVRL